MKHLYLFFLSFCIWLAACPLFVHAQIINTYAGIGPTGPWGSFSGDGGPAVLAGINRPRGIAVDTAGNVYIADNANFRVRKVNAAGIISTICGTGSSFDSGDGGPATAASLNTIRVAVDHHGNIYVNGNNRLRRIDASGIITTIAGNGTPIYSGDGGPATAATLDGLYGIAMDTADNIYIATYPGVRRIDRYGIIHAFAGTGVVGFSGDGGPATAAEFSSISDIATDRRGNVYLADIDNYVIRKVNAAGIVTTIAGTGTPGYSGDGGPATAAELYQDEGIATDTLGNIYFSDTYNDVIRKIDSNGIITTIAGVNIRSYSGDGGPATAAELNRPCGIVVAPNGIIYFADNFNNRVRVISANLFFAGGRYQLATVCTGGTLSLDTLLAANDSNAGVHEYWSLLSGPHHGSAPASYATISTGGIVYPSGLTYTPTGGYTGFDTLTVRITDSVISDTTVIYIHVIPRPVVGPITGPDSVCLSDLDTIRLADTTAGGIWLATNAHATVTGGTVMGLTAGTDTILYIVNNICGPDTVSHVVRVERCPSAVPVIQKGKEGISIYPNPATGGSAMLTVSSLYNETAHVIIFNTAGQKVKETTMDTNQPTEIQLPSSPGIYFIDATAAHGKWTGKVAMGK